MLTRSSEKESPEGMADDIGAHLDEAFYLLPPLHTLKVAGEEIRIDEPRAAFMIMADLLIQERNRAGKRPEGLTYERNSCFLQHLEILLGLWWNPNMEETHKLSKHFRGLVRDGVFETVDYKDDARRKAVRFTAFGKLCLRRLLELRRFTLKQVLARLDLQAPTVEKFLTKVCSRSRGIRRIEAEARLFRAPSHRKARRRKDT
jgi:hypothetical protein